jgi:hypothetical protein
MKRERVKETGKKLGSKGRTKRGKIKEKKEIRRYEMG